MTGLFIQSSQDAFKDLPWRFWFLRFLEIVVVGNGLVVFITGSNCRYNIIWKSLFGKDNDEYAINKVRGEIFLGFAVIRLIRSFILA